MLLSRFLRQSRPTQTNSANAAAMGFWQPLVDAGYLNTASDTDPTSAESALAYHAWYRAISLIAQKVAAVPKHLYRRSFTAAGEGKERDRQHPVYRLVHERANAEQTAFQFWLQMAGHVPSRGNGYAAIYSVNGVPTELIPMNPDRTYPIRRDGELWYVVFPFGVDSTHKGIRLRSSEVLHFRGFSFDGVTGYPVWAKAASEIGLARGQRKLEAARYQNSGRPAMLLMTDKKMADTAKLRLREDWERMHVGLNNAGRTAVLDDGLKAQAVSMTAEDLEQAGAAQMSISAISNYTGVPASKLGATGRSYASQEQEDTAFVADGLDFYLNLFEDETSAKLLTAAEREQGYEVKANREALLRPAIREKFETLRTATAGKPFMTQNEARRQLDLPPVDEPDSNRLLTPLNMGQGGAANQPTDPANDGPGRPTDAQMEAVRRTIRHVGVRLAKRVAFHANRLSSRPVDFLAWLDQMRDEHANVFRDELAPCVGLAESVAVKQDRENSHGWILDTIHARYSRVVETANAKQLPESVEQEAKQQETVVPAALITRLLGG